MLANRIGEHGYVFHAVQQDFGAGFALAVEGVADALGRYALRAHAARGGIVSAADVAGNRNKVVGVTRQAREVRHLLGINDLRKLLCLRVDDRTARTDYFHHRRLPGHGELRVHGHPAAYRHLGSSLKWRKVSARHANVVKPRLKSGYHVLARGSRRHGPFRTRRDALRHHGRARDYGACRVHNRSGDSSGFRLRPRWLTAEHHRCYQGQNDQKCVFHHASPWTCTRQIPSDRRGQLTPHETWYGMPMASSYPLIG